MRPAWVLALALLPGTARAQALINVSVPSNVEVGLDPKTADLARQWKSVVEELSKQVANLPPELQAVLKEHTPILIPRGWYEKQAKQVEDLTRTNAALLDRIEKLEGDKYDRIQGAYYCGKSQCGIKVLDKKAGKLQLHFPTMFGVGLEGQVLDAKYDPAVGLVEVYKDGKVVKTAWLNYKPGGLHTLVFDENHWWTFGPVPGR